MAGADPNGRRTWELPHQFRLLPTAWIVLITTECVCVCVCPCLLDVLCIIRWSHICMLCNNNKPGEKLSSHSLWLLANYPPYHTKLVAVLFPPLARQTDDQYGARHPEKRVGIALWHPWDQKYPTCACLHTDGGNNEQTGYARYRSQGSVPA